MEVEIVCEPRCQQTYVYCKIITLKSQFNNLVIQIFVETLGAKMVSADNNSKQTSASTTLQNNLKRIPHNSSNEKTKAAEMFHYF